MPFSNGIFSKLFTWNIVPRQHVQVFGEKLEQELSGIATALTSVGGVTTGQIAFPATQNASSNANTLDDYEEGTWTPVLTFATPGNLSVSYTFNIGAYVKVGRMMFVQMYLLASSFTHTTASGNLNITGLPFASQGSAGDGFGSAIVQGITKAGYTNFTSVVNSSGIITVVASGSGVAFSTVNAADMPTGGTPALFTSVVYMASS